MDDRLTEKDKSKRSSPTPYGDIFDELCPHYMAMGMPYDLYWNGEVGTKTAYRKAYLIRMENEQRMTDQANWNLGQYIVAALQAVPIVVNGFVPKGISMKEYPDKPFLEKELEKKKEEEKKKKDEEYRRKQEEDQQKLAMAMFQAMVTSFNKNTEAKNARKAQASQTAGQ